MPPRRSGSGVRGDRAPRTVRSRPRGSRSGGGGSGSLPLPSGDPPYESRRRRGSRGRYGALRPTGAVRCRRGRKRRAAQAGRPVRGGGAWQVAQGRALAPHAMQKRHSRLSISPHFGQGASRVFAPQYGQNLSFSWCGRSPPHAGHASRAKAGPVPHAATMASGPGSRDAFPSAPIPDASPPVAGGSGSGGSRRSAGRWRGFRWAFAAANSR